MASAYICPAPASHGQGRKLDKCAARQTLPGLLRWMAFSTCATLAAHSAQCCLAKLASDPSQAGHQGQRGASTRRTSWVSCAGSPSGCPVADTHRPNNMESDAFFQLPGSTRIRQLRQPFPVTQPGASLPSADFLNGPPHRVPARAATGSSPNSSDSQLDAYERTQSAGTPVVHEPDLLDLAIKRRLYSPPPRLPNISAAELTTFLARLKGSPLLIYGPFDNPAEPTLLTAAALEASQYWSKSIENVRTLLDIFYTGWEQLVLLPFSVRGSRSSYLKQNPGGAAPAGG